MWSTASEPNLSALVQFLLGSNVKTPFLQHSHQNWRTVPVPGFKVSAFCSSAKWYLGLKRTHWLNTILFCADAQALVLGTKCEHSLTLSKHLYACKGSLFTRPKRVRNSLSVAFFARLTTSIKLILINSWNLQYYRAKTKEMELKTFQKHPFVPLKTD